MKHSIAFMSLVLLSACGGSPNVVSEVPQPLPPIEIPGPDNVVVHGRAVVVISNEQETAFMNLFNRFIVPRAYASTGSTTVTYTNAASTNFTISVAGLAPTFSPTFTGDTLNLGSVVLSGLNDNNLKVCNPGGNTKCTQAIIRVYTTGSTAGFVHTTDLYGAPVYTGTLNPSTAVGLNAGGSVQTQLFAIGSTVHKVVLADFPSPTYAVTSDFSNAGAGPYSMTYVVEYALAP
jgi:hypothetical protein